VFGDASEGLANPTARLGREIDPECSHGFPIEIVPDSRSGWKALTAPYVINRYPQCAKRVEEAQNELRKIYGLKGR